jgi:DNA-binding transcriptional ArsR family regulator
VHAFDILGDPVRRRILELLVDGEHTAGFVATVVQSEFGISQPAVSQHLRVLRESGFATVRPEGTRRLYAVDAAPLQDIDEWIGHFRRFWEQRMDSLATELARGRRDQRLAAPAQADPPLALPPPDEPSTKKARKKKRRKERRSDDRHRP